MARPSISDLKRNQVTTFGPHSIVPEWKESAAEYGRGFVVTKVFRDIRHPSGYKSGPGPRWFAGEPAESVSGMTSTLDPGTIWLSAKMESWEEVVEAAAHETCHTFLGYDTTKEQYHEHELPTLVGKLAAAHWAGVREVYVKWGPMRDDWMPEDESEIKANAVVLHFEDGDHNTLVNVAGRWGRPRWEQRSLML